MKKSFKSTIAAILMSTALFTLQAKSQQSLNHHRKSVVKNNPIANAGAPQIITLPANSVTLKGSGTQVNGTIIAYSWSKTSGPASGTIVSPTSATTVVNNLTQGSYTFTLKVTDRRGITASSNVIITVNPAPNQPPVANAGAGQIITLPTASVTLTGSGSDADGTIASYAWSKVSGPASGTIVSPSSAKTVINSLAQGSYIFSLTVTDNGGAKGSDTLTVVVNPTGINQPPVVVASNESITLPVSSSTLTGSATSPGKTIASYKWSQVSGPSTSTIANSTAPTTTTSSLIQGMYKFSLKATDNTGMSASDTISVTVNPVITGPGCNAKAPVTYIQAPTDGTDVYVVTPNPLWKGGDTIKINSKYFSGVIEFDHVHGDPCRPIVIINSGGLVSASTIRFKSDCEYVHVTGTGDPKTTYGFKCFAGPLCGDYGQHLEFDHIEITNPNNGIGVMFKMTQDTTVAGSYYVAGANNYLSNVLHFHHLYIHNTLGEGMYIGPSDPDGGNNGYYPNGNPIIPLRLDSVEIDHCIVDSTGWDGIQLSNARFGAKIHDNIVNDFGVINEGSQQAGIILGGNTEGAVYNNTIKNGTGNGIQLFGFGQQVVYGNTIDSVGIDYLIPGISISDPNKTGQSSIFSHDYVNHVEKDSPMTVVAYNNQFIDPQLYGAIYVDGEENNSLPANVHDNKFCIPGALANWQSTYILLYVAGSSNVNNVLSCPQSRPDNAAAEAASAVNSMALKVYPNPVVSDLTVELNMGSVNQNVAISLTDLQGRVIYKNEILADQQLKNTKIDMSKLNAGVYFLNAKTATKNITQKVIKIAN